MKKQTLESLEGIIWPPPNVHAHLIDAVHRLRKKPIDEFTIEELRIVIGQGEGLQYLIPQAIAMLERDPFAEGDCYPGDLLVAVSSNKKWLKERPELFSRFQKIVLSLKTKMDNLDDCVRRELERF
jgi:hypothetical protein